jgi:hypothetical protein
MTTPPADQLSAALDATGRSIAQQHARQPKLPTPCDESDVNQRINHLVKGNRRFVVALTSKRAF